MQDGILQLIIDLVSQYLLIRAFPLIGNRLRMRMPETQWKQPQSL